MKCWKRERKSRFKKIKQHETRCDTYRTVKLPDANGVELCRQLKIALSLSEIIMLTAYGNIADGVQSIKNGAFDYITKGKDDNDKIIRLIHVRLKRSPCSNALRG